MPGDMGWSLVEGLTSRAAETVMLIRGGADAPLRSGGLGSPGGLTLQAQEEHLCLGLGLTLCSCTMVPPRRVSHLCIEAFAIFNVVRVADHRPWGGYAGRALAMREARQSDRRAGPAWQAACGQRLWALGEPKVVEGGAPGSLLG